MEHKIFYDAFQKKVKQFQEEILEIINKQLIQMNVNKTGKTLIIAMDEFDKIWGLKK